MIQPEIKQTLQNHPQVGLDSILPVQLTYEQIQVTAKIEKQISDGKGGYKKEVANRVILKKCSGKLSPYTLTAIVVFKRSAINQLRNPLGISYRIQQIVFLCILAIILFEREASSLDSKIQNTLGVLNLIVMSTVFVGIISSLNVFSQERQVFIREIYRAYYVGRSLAYLPYEIIGPFIMITIPYFVVHLDKDGDSYFFTLLAAWLCTWMSSSYGLLLSAAFEDAQVPLSLIPLLVVPLELVGGFFVPLQRIPTFFKIVSYLSMFKYQMQAFQYAQFYDDPEGFTVNLHGTDYTYVGNILGQGHQCYIQEPMWLIFSLMFLIGLAIRVIVFFILLWISKPKRMKLLPAEPLKSQKMESFGNVVSSTNLILSR